MGRAERPCPERDDMGRGPWPSDHGSTRRLGRDMGMMRPARSHPLWLAFVLHRISGLALALFLPLHFWVLAEALTDPEQLDAFLRLTDNPAVKLAEFGLVFLLAVHFFGGLRLLALEWLPWSHGQKTMAATALALAFFVSGTFFLKAI